MCLTCIIVFFSSVITHGILCIFYLYGIDDYTVDYPLTDCLPPMIELQEQCCVPSKYVCPKQLFLNVFENKSDISTAKKSYCWPIFLLSLLILSGYIIFLYAKRQKNLKSKENKKEDVQGEKNQEINRSSISSDTSSSSSSIIVLSRPSTPDLSEEDGNHVFNNDDFYENIVSDKEDFTEFGNFGSLTSSFSSVVFENLPKDIPDDMEAVNM